MKLISSKEVCSQTIFVMLYLVIQVLGLKTVSEFVLMFPRVNNFFFLHIMIKICQTGINQLNELMGTTLQDENNLIFAVKAEKAISHMSVIK